jgi:hypothetical protein
MTAITRNALLALTLQDRKPTPASVVLAAVLGLALLLLSSTVTGASRGLVLQAVLLSIALGELGGGLTQAFLTRALFARAGRPYQSGHHGAVQDFGFYDLAMAAIVLLVAWRPETYAAILYVVIALYALHGGAHVLRYTGVVAGADPNQELDLRQGLPLLVAALGLFLFRP